MEAVIFVGIQASGESSFYRERFFDTHLRINLDMLKTRHRERLLLQACIDAKQPFVVDNTNPTVEERARYIALTRNSCREGKERIPKKGILGTHKRLQVPGLEEGFDLLYHVCIDDTGHFVVKEWSDGL